MLRIHNVEHFKEVRDFSEKTERWEGFYAQLKFLADYTECGEPSLDEHRQFHEHLCAEWDRLYKADLRSLPIAEVTS